MEHMEHHGAVYCFTALSVHEPDIFEGRNPSHVFSLGSNTGTNSIYASRQLLDQKPSQTPCISRINDWCPETRVVCVSFLVKVRTYATPTPGHPFCTPLSPIPVTKYRMQNSSQNVSNLLLNTKARWAVSLRLIRFQGNKPSPTSTVRVWCEKLLYKQHDRTLRISPPKAPDFVKVDVDVQTPNPV